MLFDNIVLLIIISALVIVLGFNIVSMIDKKLSNVSINIPQIKLPKQNIVFNLKKDNNGGLEIESHTIECNVNSNSNNKTVEGFDGSIKTDDTEQKNESKNTELDELENDTKNITKSTDDNTLKSKASVIPKTADEEINDKINKKLEQCEKKEDKEELKERIHAYSTQASPYDYALYYRKYRAEAAKLGLDEYGIKGYNYTAYNDTVSPDKIASRLIPIDDNKPYKGQYVNIPIGYDSMK